jgi:flagellar hook-basal body complex protein FliE
MITPVPSLGPVGRLGAAETAPAPRPATGDFATVLAEFGANAVNTVKTAEVSAIAGITGNVPVQQVVESVMSAEQALQTALAVRDKLIAAYQEISRMAI